MRKVSHASAYLQFLIFICILAAPSSFLAQTHKIDSLLTLLKTQKEDTSKVNTLSELARAYLFDLNDCQKVGEYGSKQLALSLKLNFNKGIAYGYLNRAIFYRSSGELDSALVYDKKSLPVMIEMGNKKGESSCYLNIGLTLSHQGNFKEALEYMFKGMKIKEQIGDKKGMCSGYNNIGNIYEDQANYAEALKFQLKSLKIREELGDKIGIAMAFNNIGNVVLAQGKSDDALLYYHKSLKISEGQNDLLGIGSSNANMGNIYLAQKNYREARICFFKSLKAREQIDDKRGLAEIFNNIGGAYFLEKKTEEALIYHLKSFKLYEKTGDKKGIAEACGGIANSYTEKKEYEHAFRYCDQMLSLSKELGYKDGIRDAYRNLSNLYKKQKQFEKALQFTNLYNATKDSLLNTENFKQVSELNTRYETDKKEKEILLLTKDQELNAKIIKQQQLVRWGLIGGVTLLFISIFSIYRRYRFKQKANDLLETQNQEIQEKNTLITDSIDYAKTIQEAVLPSTAKIHDLFPQSFILNKPKSIVSGDFYWVNKIDDQLVCAVADCTGHGVPGAFMSLLGYNMLENEVKKNAVREPAVILDNLNAQIIKSLSKEEDEVIKHGMDISLISIDTTTNLLHYAGAHNSVYIIRDGQLTELKADKKAIGSLDKKGDIHFTPYTFQLQKDDMIYLHTDGFPDQIGGPNRKKFYYQPFKDLLISISALEMQEQKEKLDTAHRRWLGEKMEQTDDILIMGIRI
jgi:serine phosphatase RsbU (regulator of sigma subunit)/tetratricopeptide (TPR) repeat protein